MRSSVLNYIKAATLLGLVIGAAGPVRADLVTNGNFATGDFTGYTLSGDSSMFYVSGSPGNYAAALTTSTADGFLSQTLATTIGQQYTVSFMLAGDGAAPNTFTASLGGTTLVSLTNVPNTLPNYTTYTSQYIASSTSSLLSFDVRDDPGYLYVTNISVVASSVAVPEPPTIVGVVTGLMMLAGHSWRKWRKMTRA